MEVTLSKFKNNIDHYLSEAQNGKEVIIRHRKKVIAKLAPPIDLPEVLETDEEIEAEMQELAAKGLLKLSGKKMDEKFWDEFLALPAPAISLERVVAAVVAEREENRY